MKRALLASALLVIITFLGCGQVSKTELSDVRDLLTTGHWDQAQKIVDSLLAVDSLDLKASYGRGLLQEHHGLEWDAMISYLEGSRADQGYSPAMKDFIRMAIKLEYYENGRKMANILTTQNPDDPEAQFLTAELELAQNRLDSAKARIEAGAALTTDNNLILLYQSELDLHSYDESKIEATLDRLSKADFSTAAEYRHLARLYKYLNLAGSEIHALEQAVDADDNNYPLKIELAQAYFDNRWLSEAIDLADKVLKKSNNYGNARVVAAYGYYTLGRRMKAALYFLEYAEIHRHSPIPLEKHGDFLGYFNVNRQAMFEYQSAFLRAENEKYVDDYIIHLFYKLCYSLLDNRDPMSSKEKLDQYEVIDPNSYDMFFLKTNTMLAYPEMQDSARSLVDKRLAEHEDDRRWLEMAAHHYYRVMRPQKSINMHNKVLNFPYPGYETYIGLLEIYKDLIDTESVDQLADMLPYRFRNNRTIMEMIRDIYRAGKAFDKAVLYAEKIYNASPNYLPDLLILSEIYSSLQRIDDVKALLERYAEDNPDAAEAYFRLAEFELEHGDQNKILPHLSKAQALDSTFGSTFELKGLYFLDNNQIDSAMYYFRKTIKLDWRTPLAYFHLAEYLFQLGDSLARVEGLGMAAVRLFGTDDPRGHLLLGNAYLIQKKYKLARQQFHKGVMQFPDHAELHFLLGKSFGLLKEKAKARKWLNRALKKDLSAAQEKETRELLQNL